MANKRKYVTPMVVVALAPVLFNAHLLLQFANPDPVLAFAGLETAIRKILGGQFTIDHNVGFTSHALGHRAAEMLFSGRMPWWNHFEGIGMPLAGEMQSAALFPFTWLLLLPQGQLIEHIALQIVAGLCTYALLRRMRMPTTAAVAGSIVYEFNGVFAWLTNAVCNPIAFLPMLLWGIERSIAAAREGNSRGQGAIAAAIALSLYAGFPEVAYLNGLFAALWSLVRLRDLSRKQATRAVLMLSVGTVGGLLLAAPALVPFLDFLPYSAIGTHDSMRPNDQHQSLIALAAVPFPYVFGTIFAPSTAADFWGSVGGYAGVLLSVLALAGTVGKTDRPIRLLMAGWTLGCMLTTFGILPGRWIGAVVPGVRYVYLARYLPSSWIMCMTVLAAFALSDMTATGWSRTRLNAGFAGLAVALLALWVLAAHPVTPLPNVGTVALCAISVVLGVAALYASNSNRADGRRQRIVAYLLAAESVILFLVPTLSYPRSGAVDLSGVRYLQAHLGLSRFATLGPIRPNYGTYFGIASVNYDDLPAYGPWVTWVTTHMDRNSDPVAFDGVVRLQSQGPSAAAEFEHNMSGYAAAGVRFVVARPDQVVAKLKPVFRAPTMTIYALPGAASYLEATGCALTASDRDHFVAHCSVATRLIRREAWMPGWAADVGGRAVRVDRSGPLFQGIILPPGTTQVSFDYQPPNIRLGFLLALAGGGLLFIPHFFRRRSRSVSPASV